MPSLAGKSGGSENKGEVPLRLEEEIRVVALRSNVLWVEPAEDGTPEIKNESKL